MAAKRPRKGSFFILLTLPMLLPVKDIFYGAAISDMVGASFTLVMFFGVVRRKLRKEMSA